MTVLLSGCHDATEFSLKAIGRVSLIVGCKMFL